MWICLNDAFLSIVQDHFQPGGFVVRARRRGHLTAVFGKVKIETDEGTDYRYRTFLPKPVVVAAISARLSKVRYTNFKDSVADRELHDLYFQFWMDAVRYQDDEPPRPKRGARRPAGGRTGSPGRKDA